MYENTEKLQSNEVEDLGAAPSTIPLEMEQLPGESIFDYTQRIRKEMIINSCAKGIPSDPKDVAMVNNILNSMDAQEVNKARIANEDKAANADKEASNLIRSLLTMVGNSNPYLAENPVPRDIKATGTIGPGVTLVEGELDQSHRVLNHATFMAEQRAKNPKQAEEDDD